MTFAELEFTTWEQNAETVKRFGVNRIKSPINESRVLWF